MAQSAGNRTRLSTPAAAQGLRDIRQAMMAGRGGIGPGHIVPRYQPYQPYRPQDVHHTYMTDDTVQIKEEDQSDIDRFGDAPVILIDHPALSAILNEQTSHHNAHQTYPPTNPQNQLPTHGSPTPLSIINSGLSQSHYTPPYRLGDRGRQGHPLPPRSSRSKIDPNSEPTFPFPSPWNKKQRKKIRYRFHRKLQRQHAREQQRKALGKKGVRPATATAANQPQTPTQINTDSSIPNTPTTNPANLATPSPTPAPKLQAPSKPEHKTAQTDSDSDSSSQKSTPSTPTNAQTTRQSTMANSREKILKLMLKEQRKEIKFLRTILLEKKVNWLMVEEIKKRMASDGLSKQVAIQVVLKAHGHTLKKELVSDSSDNE